MTGRHVRQRLAVVTFGLLVLAGCGTSTGPSAAPIPPGLDGTEAGQLPTAPTPTTPPALPNPSTESGRKEFLAQVFTDMQQMWSGLFAAAHLAYTPARLVFFTSRVTTTCGQATSAVGPFYCPADQSVYLDTRFFDEMEQRYGVKGDFSQAYVVAHEMGHHIQNLLGINGRVAAAERSNPSLKNPLSIRVELQADCLAGVWAHSTYERKLLEPGDLDEALRAASAVGDDFLQQAATGQVAPEEWTHGTSAQRQHWLTIGYDSGETAQCDTLRASG